MLFDFNVDGFKSLRKLALSLNVGLNVLIGPNGAGKTNICQALGLLSAGAKGSIPEYILQIGGTDAIFARSATSNPTLQKRIRLTCRGAVSGDYRYQGSPAKSIRAGYTYSLTIFLKENQISYEEEVKIGRHVESQKRLVPVISAKLTKTGKITIKFTNRKLLGPATKTKAKSNAITLNTKRTNACLLEILDYYALLGFLVRDDLSKANVLNIDPHVARQSADLLESDSMAGDGRRLANALHGLQEQQPDDLAQVNDFLSTIIPRFKSIVPENASHGVRSFCLQDIDKNRIPTAGISDGTIKAVSVLVGLHQSGVGTLAIEEPENYLHPWACKSIIEFLRSRPGARSFILTTHSETILNSVRPDEIIVCENTNGITTIRRASEIKDLQKAISESGFGCGYHYVAGALEGVP